MKFRLLNLKRPFPETGPRFLSAADQTMRSWAMRLHDIDEVPEMFRECFASLPLEPGVFPYTVLTPTYESFFIRTSPKLICLVDPDIYVIEHRHKEPAVTHYPSADINYIESGNILLKAWLRISGITQTGLTSSSFQFNAVTQPFIDPLIEKMRAIKPPFASTDFDAERAKFLHLLKVHYKFMNYARRSILPGERVITSLVQPEIRTRVLKAFYRTITPAHISILTDQELILITEDNKRLTRKGAPYGGIWHYIPLRRITAASLVERDEHTLTLTIQMPQEDRISAIIGMANRAEAEALVHQIEELIA